MWCINTRVRFKIESILYYSHTLSNERGFLRGIRDFDRRTNNLYLIVTQMIIGLIFAAIHVFILLFATLLGHEFIARLSTAKATFELQCGHNSRLLLFICFITHSVIHFSCAGYLHLQSDTKMTTASKWRRFCWTIQSRHTVFFIFFFEYRLII